MKASFRGKRSRAAYAAPSSSPARRRSTSFPIACASRSARPSVSRRNCSRSEAAFVPASVPPYRASTPRSRSRTPCGSSSRCVARYPRASSRAVGPGSFALEGAVAGPTTAGPGTRRSGAVEVSLEGPVGGRTSSPPRSTPNAIPPTASRPAPHTQAGTGRLDGRGVTAGRARGMVTELGSGLVKTGVEGDAERSIVSTSSSAGPRADASSYPSPPRRREALSGRRGSRRPLERSAMRPRTAGSCRRSGPTSRARKFAALRASSDASKPPVRLARSSSMATRHGCPRPSRRTRLGSGNTAARPRASRGQSASPMRLSSTTASCGAKGPRVASRSSRRIPSGTADTAA